ncbi:HNH endonuclease signature motif containing protein [Pseudarthrobacter sp. NamE5]|uniref:HNH endonuclease signature motif containing protein n=1 Tax=Pseudarthrobacter sp. NamE5 TaxID=2576839 RepID=UPI00110A1F05|nr:HNH endonuclease signature motif containing protein [Pseudarthrobacter sp. NamE5]TLM88012.1 DUF222 domain-containing protein [Pseudarthrobacter sp. NamE5]
MEATGDQFGEYGRSTALLTRAGSRGDNPAPEGLARYSRYLPADSDTAASEGVASVSQAAESPAKAAAAHPEATASHSQAAASANRPLPMNTKAAPSGATSLGAITGLLASAVAAAPAALAAADYVEASHFAGQAEEFSRAAEYLQLLAAGTVDRTRREAVAAAEAARSSRSRGWVTGWDNGSERLDETDTDWPGPAAAAAPTGEAGSAAPVPAGIPADSTGAVVPSPTDDGCRNTAEFLRLRLRIPLREARRRLALAQQVLPGTSLTGQPIPPARPHLAAALTPAPTETATETATGTGVVAPVVSSYAGTIITATLDRLQHRTSAENLDRIEQDLTTTAATADPDFVARLAQRWTDTIDADGTEPSEEALRHTQGAFIRKPRHGLHHLEIFATTDQYEHLLTAMNAATNPRTKTETTNDASSPASGEGNYGRTGAPGVSTTAARTTTESRIWSEKNPELDRRTRSQKQLDGIIGAVKAALATHTLPTTGGNRPQIIATINHRDLLPRLNHHPGTGNFVFTGPVAAATLRKIACDADIIPALLGSHGEILDLGRKTRLFTPAQRLALTARDQGCTFPNCTIPAPWCEAHHITYWSHGGFTTTDNGVLLCTHHHHLIHKEQWTITIRNHTPWYTPPPHIDPHQKPQQNHYFKTPPPPGKLE